MATTRQQALMQPGSAAVDHDQELMHVDKAYLESKGVDRVFKQLLHDILQQQPQEPVQYMIDALSMNAQEARQDPKTGLPWHRQRKLEQVFTIIDRDGSGRISLRKLQAYANKYGGQTLALDDLRSIFKDFKPTPAAAPALSAGAAAAAAADALDDSCIQLPEFLRFFSRVSRTINNKDFERMVDEMSQ